MANMHKAITVNEVSDVSNYKDFLRYHINNSVKITINEKEDALNKVDRLPQGNKLFHGDFHLGNIIIMNSGNSIGIIDFGIVYYLTDEISNNLFDIMFLSLNKNNIKNFYTILKIAIGMNCSNKCQHEFIFKILKEDKTIVELLHRGFSANFLIKVINKIVSLDNVDLVPDACKLFLSTMSGLQTIEYTNNNKSLDALLRMYINKSIMIE
jgi:predicted unusual protein kinase regulating ubiquinone biosynthesis (AarF/ABC1/UbiB family)